MYRLYIHIFRSNFKYVFNIATIIERYIHCIICTKTLYLSIILYKICIQTIYNSGEVNINVFIHMYIQSYYTDN